MGSAWLRRAQKALEAMAEIEGSFALWGQKTGREDPRKPQRATRAFSVETELCTDLSPVIHFTRVCGEITVGQY